MNEASESSQGVSSVSMASFIHASVAMTRHRGGGGGPCVFASPSSSTIELFTLIANSSDSTFVLHNGQHPCRSINHGRMHDL